MGQNYIFILYRPQYIKSKTTYISYICRLKTPYLELVKITISNTMVSVTETAKKKIFSLLEEEGLGTSAYVKVGVSSGGCSGLSYKLDFTSERDENDKLIEDNEVRILIDKKSLLYLAGTILDFSGGLNGKGFTFSNPNATRTCGCGESFAV
jgi:iron-sulfur cluster assembly protein